MYICSSQDREPQTFIGFALRSAIILNFQSATFFLINLVDCQENNSLYSTMIANLLMLRSDENVGGFWSCATKHSKGSYTFKYWQIAKKVTGCIPPWLTYLSYKSWLKSETETRGDVGFWREIYSLACIHATVSEKKTELTNRPTDARTTTGALLTQSSRAKAKTIARTNVAPQPHSIRACEKRLLFRAFVERVIKLGRLHQVVPVSLRGKQLPVTGRFVTCQLRLENVGPFGALMEFYCLRCYPYSQHSVTATRQCDMR